MLGSLQRDWCSSCLRFLQWMELCICFLCFFPQFVWILQTIKIMQVCLAICWCPTLTFHSYRWEVLLSSLLIIHLCVNFRKLMEIITTNWWVLLISMIWSDGKWHKCVWFYCDWNLWYHTNCRSHGWFKPGQFSLSRNKGCVWTKGKWWERKKQYKQYENNKMILVH